MKMYYTTNYGDVNIEQVGDNIILRTTSLTAIEEKTLNLIIAKYREKISNISDIENTLENKEFTIENVKLNDLHKIMTKTLKKDKPLMTVLKFKDGRIDVTEELKSTEVEKSSVGATVEKPRKHCPIPSFMETEFRASNVLKEFLTDKQMKDFINHKQFISKGNDTGRTYLITSRWSPEISKYGHIYCLTTDELICANCDELPPSEEMLSLKLILEFREREFLGDRIT